MKIIAIHLLNDFSGSPRVLRQLVRGWLQHHVSVTVLCNEGTGLLSDIPGADYQRFRYRWHANPIMRLINLLMSQWHVFWLIIRLARRNDIVYINTVLPFAAAWAGRLQRCRVVYHLHETSVRPALLKWFLFSVMKLLAHDVIYVSRYLALAEPVGSARTHLLPNAMDAEFVSKVKVQNKRNKIPTAVLMICSLKVYKGVHEFVALAQEHPSLNFQLVLNASERDIKKFFQPVTVPPNLQLFPVQQNLHPFYQQADVIVNLSRVDQWIETFGLTILEGMAYGLPALVPPLGGVTELVAYGYSGYWADARDLADVSAKLTAMLQPATYARMHAHTANRALNYSEDAFTRKSLELLGFQKLDAFSSKWNQTSQNP